MRLQFSIAGFSSELDYENLDHALGYVGSEILNHRTDRERRILEVELAEGAAPAEIEEKLSKLLRKLQPIRARPGAAAIVDRSSEPVPCREDILQLLIDRRDVVFHAPGACALQGKLQRMFQALDRRLLAFALSQNAEEAIYPVTIALKTLQRSNFFSHYPQFATFQSTLDSDFENISEAAKKLSGAEDLDFLEHLTTPATMCRSAGCLHAYPTYAGEIFAPDRTLCVTMLGRMFRNEGRNVAGLERLNEYSMREIIYFGSAEFVARRLAECRDWCVDYLQRFRLRGVIQPANDPFFADNLAALQYFQRSEQSKFEFRLVNPFTDNSISVASINHHRDHFSKSYDIKFPNAEYVQTGCFGVGYERLLFVTLAQYGYDENEWPEELRDFYFEPAARPRS